MYYLADFCRLCLSLEGDLNNMCNDNIIEKASACLGELEFDYNLSNLICNECLEKLEAFFNFRNRCLQSEFFLNRYIELLLQMRSIKEFKSSKLRIDLITNFGASDTKSPIKNNGKVYEKGEEPLNSKCEQIPPIIKDCQVEMNDLSVILGLGISKSKESSLVEDVQKNTEINEHVLTDLNELTHIVHIDDDDDIFLEEEDDENCLPVPDLAPLSFHDSHATNIPQFNVVHSDLIGDVVYQRNENIGLSSKRKSSDTTEYVEKKLKCSTSDQDFLTNEINNPIIVTDEDTSYSASNILTNITERVKLRKRQAPVNTSNKTFQDNFINSTNFKQMHRIRLPQVHCTKKKVYDNVKDGDNTTCLDANLLSLISSRNSCITRFEAPTPITKSTIATDTDIENDIASHYIHSVVKGKPDNNDTMAVGTVKPHPAVLNKNVSSSELPTPTSMKIRIPALKKNVSRNDLHLANDITFKPVKKRLQAFKIVQPQPAVSNKDDSSIDLFRANLTTVKSGKPTHAVIYKSVSSNELYQANFSNILQLSTIQPSVMTSSKPVKSLQRPFNIIFHNIGKAQQNVKIETKQVNKPLITYLKPLSSKKDINVDTRTFNSSLLSQTFIGSNIENTLSKTADKCQITEINEEYVAIHIPNDNSTQSPDVTLGLDTNVTDCKGDSLINGTSSKNTVIKEHNYSSKSDKKSKKEKCVKKDKAELETKDTINKQNALVDNYTIDDPLNMLTPFSATKKRSPKKTRKASSSSKKMSTSLLRSALSSGNQQKTNNIDSTTNSKHSDSEDSDVDVETIPDRSYSDVSFNVSILKAAAAKQADVSAKKGFDSANNEVSTDQPSPSKSTPIDNENHVVSSYFEDGCNAVVKDVDITFIENDLSDSLNQHSDADK